MGRQIQPLYLILQGYVFRMKTLWIVSGGTEAVPGIQRAKEMGLNVVVSDGDPEAPGFEIADQKVVVSTYDIADTIGAAKKYHSKIHPIDGVICIAADVPLTVASVAEELGLPGISVESACLAIDKLAMKRCFDAADIPIPWFSPVNSIKHLYAIVNERGFPLIIKPVDSRGARGVLRLTKGVDLDWAFQYAQSYSLSSQVMVEEYLHGPQITTESVLLDGVGFTPGFSERNYEYLDRFAPYIIENGGQFPSELSHNDQQAIAQMAVKAAKAMKITTGIAKGDMVLTEEGPKVIEIAARLSGGWFCTDQVPLGTGIDLVGIAIRIALGETILPEYFVPKFHKGVAIRYFFPKPGRVLQIKNIAQFNNVSWVHKLGFFVKPGDIIEPVTDHTKRAGFVITSDKNRNQAVARAHQVIETIKIETIPV